MKKILFTGGGTGGHIMPNLAIIDDLKNKYKISYIGSKTGMEKDIVGKDVPYFEVTTCKLRRSLSFSNLLIPFKLLKVYFEAKRILKKEKPNLVFSKGGYVAVPVVLACKKLKIPVVSHESDYSIGLANKLTQRFSKAVCTSFEATSKSIKNGVYTGSPIRKIIFQGNKNNVINKLNLIPTLPNILIVGGSLGSQTLNKIVNQNIQDICKKFNIVHIIGKNNQSKSNIKNYNILPYANNIQDYIDICDIVITRGGSNAIFEFLATKKPMLIIPLEKGSRGDQVLNAKEFERENLALWARESDLEADKNLFLKMLENLFENRKTFANNMSKKYCVGNRKIIEQIEKYMK